MHSLKLIFLTAYLTATNPVLSMVICFEPKRMLAIQVSHPPEKIPYKNAIKNLWSGQVR
jgi:hypothetical protein